MKRLTTKVKLLTSFAMAPAMTLLIPTANAKNAAAQIAILCSKLLNIFFYAGILLLVWSIISLIISLKNEDAESKVQAITQLGVAITCMTLSTIINGLLSVTGAGVSIT